jgi:hypothetical protein
MHKAKIICHRPVAVRIPCRRDNSRSPEVTHNVLGRLLAAAWFLMYFVSTVLYIAISCSNRTKRDELR